MRIKDLTNKIKSLSISDIMTKCELCKKDVPLLDISTAIITDDVVVKQTYICVDCKSRGVWMCSLCGYVYTYFDYNDEDEDHLHYRSDYINDLPVRSDVHYLYKDQTSGVCSDCVRAVAYHMGARLGRMKYVAVVEDRGFVSVEKYSHHQFHRLMARFDVIEKIRGRIYFWGPPHEHTQYQDAEIWWVYDRQGVLQTAYLAQSQTRVLGTIARKIHKYPELRGESLRHLVETKRQIQSIRDYQEFRRSIKERR